MAYSTSWRVSEDESIIIDLFENDIPFAKHSKVYANIQEVEADGGFSEISALITAEYMKKIEDEEAARLLAEQQAEASKASIVQQAQASLGVEPEIKVAVDEELANQKKASL